jgi:hypothetical protein
MASAALANLAEQRKRGSSCSTRSTALTIAAACALRTLVARSRAYSPEKLGFTGATDTTAMLLARESDGP